MPLTGKRILVTSAGSKGEDFSSKLQKLGVQALLLPMIELNDPDSWQALDIAINNLNSYHWILFASSNAVTSFVRRLAHHQGLDGEKLVLEKKPLPVTITKILPKVAVIGEITATTGSKYGILADYYPNNYLAEDFIAQFPGYPNNLADTHILWPRTNLGRDLIMAKLQEVSAVVDVVPAYKTDLPADTAKLNKQLQEISRSKNLDAITIASKQTAINLAKILCLELEPRDISRNLLFSSFLTDEAVLYLKQLLADILIVTIGPEASAGALHYLGKVNLEAESHTGDGMINALIEYYSQSEK